jgi:hypothetical protein
MNTDLGIFLVVLAILGLLAGAGAAQGEAVGPSVVHESAVSTQTAVETAGSTELHMLSGAAVGGGIGIVIGSGFAFIFWDRRIG